jgi:hypothetical protein
MVSRRLAAPVSRQPSPVMKSQTGTQHMAAWLAVKRTKITSCRDKACDIRDSG